MRLTCPNCGAQYEVPDEVIPESGRDVQCSNCGDTWFQHHPDHIPEEDAPTEADWDAPPDDAAEDTSDTLDEPEDAEPARRELDPEVSEVLREEAERERAARAAEASTGLETQAELGLTEAEDSTDQRLAQAQARMARLKGEPEAAEDTDDWPDPGTRRNLLPDIDEINSSLDSDSTDPGMVHTGETGDMTASNASGGFRRGFLTMVFLAVVALLLYMFAPQLAEAVPALDGALSAYVDLVNGLRSWLNQTIDGLTGG